MAAQQFIIEAYDKLRDLWDAHAPLSDPSTGLVKVGNWIDWREGKAVTKRYGLRSGKAPNDYPEVSLDLGGFEDGMFRDTPHFGMRNPAVTLSAMTWTETFRQDFTFTIVFDYRQHTPATTEQLVLMETLTAIRKGGPRLQLNSVQRWGPVTGERGVEVSDETANVERPVVRISVPVFFLFNGQSLIT